MKTAPPFARSSPAAAYRMLSVAVAAALLAFASPSVARAGLVLSTPSFQANAGGSGTFEVVLSNTSATESYKVSAFGTQVSVDPASGVTFTDISTATSPASRFLFDGLAHDPLTALDEGPSPPEALSSPFAHWATQLYFSDSTTYDGAAFPYRVVGPGENYVLAVLSYKIAPSAAPGLAALLLDLTADQGGFTDVSDPDGGSFALDGEVSVSSGAVLTVASVPEPSTFVLAGTAGLPVAIGLLLRKRRAA